MFLQASEFLPYMEQGRDFFEEWRPVGIREIQYVQKIIDTHTRLNRVAALDNNMLNFGLLENLSDADHKAAQDSGADADTAVAHAQAKSWIAQQMSFDNQPFLDIGRLL